MDAFAALNDEPEVHEIVVSASSESWLADPQNQVLAASGVGTFFYLWAFVARLRGKRGKSAFLRLLGAAAVTAGGFLGGQLVFGKEDDEPTTSEFRPGTDRFRVAV